MNKLIIVTGISGSGKSTISNYIYNYYERATLLSMDVLKENIYDIVGFYNYEQKQDLKKVVYDTFIKLLNECMSRKDEKIIVEYPFSKSWEDKFIELLNTYNYDAITIRVRGESFDSIYERLTKRDNSSFRHPSHSVSNYDPKIKNEYKSKSKLKFDKLKQDYNTNKYTSIELGNVIDFINNKFDYSEIIEAIDNK